MGVPMLFLIGPLFVLAFIPIVLIETSTLKKHINISTGKAVKVVFTSNAVSSFIGVPFIWLGLLIIQLATPGGGGTFPGLSLWSKTILSVTLQAPWLLPYESQLYWMVPAATMFMMPFFFIGSYYIELGISKLMLRKSQNISSQQIKQGVWYGNIHSYLLLIGIVIMYLLYQLYEQGFIV